MNCWEFEDKIKDAPTKIPVNLYKLMKNTYNLFKDHVLDSNSYMYMFNKNTSYSDDFH